MRKYVGWTFMEVKKAPWINRHTMHSLARVESVRESLGIQLTENTEKNV